jgi:hypothetical protein
VKNKATSQKRHHKLWGPLHITNDGVQCNHPGARYDGTNGSLFGFDIDLFHSLETCQMVVVGFHLDLKAPAFVSSMDMSM